MSIIPLIVLLFSACALVSSEMIPLNENGFPLPPALALEPHTRFFWNLLPWFPLPNFPTRRPATAAASTVATCRTGVAATATGCACGTARCTTGQFCNTATMTCLTACRPNMIVPATPAAGCACGSTGAACAAGRGCTTTCVAPPTVACAPTTNPGNSPCLCGTTGICPTATSMCTVSTNTCR